MAISLLAGRVQRDGRPYILMSIERWTQVGVRQNDGATTGY
ncbi:hypothetical protein QFZ67_006530 [Streptomyces sp. V1I1]|nr:hypothetical protein [Streptomyces sp. V1I1]